MNYFRYITAILLLVSLSSCEEVVNVDLETAAPRLVIDAGIDWVKGTDGQQQTIRLTTTTGYYNTTIPVVSDAQVFVTDTNGNTFDFIENPGTGNYICNNFIPVIEGQYTLTVNWNGQTYVATESLKAVPEISSVIQNNEGGFLGDEIEVRFFFQDDASAENYYYLKIESPVLAFPELDTFSDEFFNGNESFGFFSDEDLEAGQNVNFRFFGVSRRYSEYIYRILQNTGTNVGPFGTAASTVRGNIFNSTNPNDYALGFFRLSEVDTLDYVVE